MDATTDRLNIIEHVLQYSLAAKRLDGHALGRRFTSDAKLGGVAKLVGQPDADIVGGNAIGAFFSAVFESMEFVHQIPQVTGIEIRGDQATATTMLIEYARAKGGKLMTVIGEYTDEFVRSGDGWLFSGRVLDTKVFTYLVEAPL
jgi:hypothetical protein